MTNALLFVAMVLIWGTTWIGIAMQVGPVPALVSVFYRFALSTVIFFVALAALGRLRIPSRRDAPFIFAQALCLYCFNFLCMYVAARWIPSGLESVIFSLASVFNAINSRIFYGERIAPRTLIAGAIGVVGVALMFAHDLLIAFNLATLQGAALATLGAVIFSLGNMASRRNNKAGVPTEITNAWGMAMGAGVLLALILGSETPFVAPPDARYVGALVYLAVFGTVIGYTLYLMLVARLGAAKAAYSAVLFPLVALVVSTIFEGYRWSPLALMGLALTLIGNVVMFWPPKRTS